MGTSGLGSLLVEEGLLTEADRRTIKRTCGSTGSAFARSIIAMGLLDEDELAAFLAEKTHWRVAAKELFGESRQDVWGVVDRPLVERLEVLPLKIENGTLHVAMVDPLDHDTIRQLAFFTGLKVHPVISTLTAIRAGLAKLLKDYRPPSSHLEDFLTNHAGSASRMQRLRDKRPSKKKKTPAKPAEKVAAPAAPEADTFGDEVLEDEPPTSNALEYPDSVNAAEDRAPAPPPAPAAAASLASSADTDEDLDLGELDATFDDDLGAPATPPAAKAASAEIDELVASGEGAKEASDEELENLGFGDSELEGDLEGDLDLADLDPDAEAKPAKAKAPAATVAPTAAPLEGLEGLDDLEGELDADLGELSADLDADLGLESPTSAEDTASELAADLAPAAKGEENLDAILGLEEPADGGELPLDAAPDTRAADDELSLDDVATPTPAAAAETMEHDPFAGIEDADLDAKEPTPFDDEPAPVDAPTPAAAPGSKPTAVSGDQSLEGRTAALNRALVAMTMANKPEAALVRAAPALVGAGLARGILLVVHGGKVTPVSAWQAQGGEVAVTQDGLASYLTPGLTPALARLFAGWTEFDAVRGNDLKPFAAWVTKDHALLATLIPIDATRQLAVVTAWHASTREDQTLKSSALEVFRRLAKKV